MQPALRWNRKLTEARHSVLPMPLVPYLPGQQPIFPIPPLPPNYFCHLLSDVLQIHCDGAANEIFDGCLLSDGFRNFIAALLFHLSLCKLGAFSAERLQVSFERFKQSGGLGQTFLVHSHDGLMFVQSLWRGVLVRSRVVWCHASRLCNAASRSLSRRLSRKFLTAVVAFVVGAVVCVCLLAGEHGNTTRKTVHY